MTNSLALRRDIVTSAFVVGGLLTILAVLGLLH
jgi:hypothetical protein